jgi:hypothetical protein
VGRGRKSANPAAYIEAWKTQNYDTIHHAALKEASRQVNEMVKWMNWQTKYAPKWMKETYEEDGIFDLIRKARNYREHFIYQRNRLITEAPMAMAQATLDGDAKKIDALKEQIAQWEDYQHGGCRRILKIYLHVKGEAGGSLELTEPEEVEYEYDPEG